MIVKISIGILVLAVIVGSYLLYKKFIVKPKPVDPCADGSCKPVDPCADGSCDTPTTPPIPKEPLVIKLTLVPENKPTMVPGHIYSNTISVTAIEEITGNDCADCIKRQWFLNGIPAGDGTNKLIQTNLDDLKAGKIIKYEITVGDNPPVSISEKIL